MSDLISRLKSWSSFVAEGYEVPAASLCMNEAADCLATLEAENARLREAMSDAGAEYQADLTERDNEIARLKADKAKLVEGLRKYACRCLDMPNVCSDNDKDLADCGWQAARLLKEVG